MNLRRRYVPGSIPVIICLFADVHGHIGYRTRGQIPIRSRANAWLPVPWPGQLTTSGKG